MNIQSRNQSKPLNMNQKNWMLFFIFLPFSGSFFPTFKKLFEMAILQNNFFYSIKITPDPRDEGLSLSGVRLTHSTNF